MYKKSKDYVDDAINQVQDESIRDLFGRKKEIDLHKNYDDWKQNVEFCKEDIECE